MDHQLPLASSSATTLVPHPFASSSVTLVPNAVDDAAGTKGLKCRKASNSSLNSDLKDQTSDSESDADICDISKFKPNNLDRVLLPLRFAGNLAARRPKKASQMNKKGERLRSQCLELQYTHADEIPAPRLALLKGTQAALEYKAEKLHKERDKAKKATSGWLDRQCINYKAQKEEVGLYSSTKMHHKETKWVSEMAKRSKIDKALQSGDLSLADIGKGKGRARDDINLSRVVPNPFRTAYPKS
ncbi:hypothetical protein K443DRAFT_678195 [Laccaria amethystina LaAM-08-1]|uniref:Uncharacterized protein n=1 Tax=Laccaria amethystina LaAM-08-1 TaxID=1095629 RepID=A0A0C9XJJ8_9AGAR|nr:hypothetical protein K443DRAFT_678195 [Laccaria amethystina LaAM-08-1]